MPVPIERRKSSKQLLEEKQIKRYLRQKRRSSKRGVNNKENSEPKVEIKDPPKQRKFKAEKEVELKKEPLEVTEVIPGPWTEYKITEYVTTETSITYVKIPKKFLENKNLIIKDR